MKINGLTPVYFDIETTGFSSWEDEFICAASDQGFEDFGIKFSSITTSLRDTMQKFGVMRSKFNFLLVTYNGENWSGGFDFPWLRSKCIQQGVEWQLSGAKHLDLLPLVRKYLNTTGYEPPQKSSLYADDLKSLAEANGIEYSNKSQCYEELEEMEEVDWLDYEKEPNEDNSLQSVYQKLFDPKKEEKYLSGDEIPKLYEILNEKMFEKGEACEESIWRKIINHNKRDVKRLKKVAEKVIPVLPDWEIERNINKL